MNLYESLKAYQPFNEQEERDKELMLSFIEKNEDYLERTNCVAHFTTSLWVVNPSRTKVLMIYHNIYNSWSWVGGHADGDEDLQAVAMRELTEETGVQRAEFVSEEIFSLESLTVDGHEKRGAYVSSHLHLNVTYLVVVEEEEKLMIKPDENSGVKWFAIEEIEKVCSEKWLYERIYKKLIGKVEQVNYLNYQ